MIRYTVRYIEIFMYDIAIYYHVQSLRVYHRVLVPYILVAPRAISIAVKVCIAVDIRSQ